MSLSGAISPNSARNYIIKSKNRSMVCSLIQIYLLWLMSQLAVKCYNCVWNSWLCFIILLCFSIIVDFFILKLLHLKSRYFSLFSMKIFVDCNQCVNTEKKCKINFTWLYMLIGLTWMFIILIPFDNNIIVKYYHNSDGFLKQCRITDSQKSL